jgi:hypothetical protein
MKDAILQVVDQVETSKFHCINENAIYEIKTDIKKLFSIFFILFKNFGFSRFIIIKISL